MDLRKTAATVILAAASSLNVSASKETEPVTVTLVRDGRPAASIVTAVNPTPSAHLAALELQYHIRKITGAVVPIRTDRQDSTGTRILVGQNKETRALGIEVEDFPPLEYLIQFRPGAIVLIGRDWQDTPENRAELGRSTYGDTLASYRHKIDYHKGTGRSSEGTRRITLPVGVAYGTKPRKVLEILAKVPQGHPEVLEDPPPESLFVGFGDSSLDFELRVFTTNAQAWERVRSDLALATSEALEAAGIQIPFPQRDLHLKNVAELGAAIRDRRESEE